MGQGMDHLNPPGHWQAVRGDHFEGEFVHAGVFGWLADEVERERGLAEGRIDLFVLADEQADDGAGRAPDATPRLRDDPPAVPRQRHQTARR